MVFRNPYNLVFLVLLIPWILYLITRGKSTKMGRPATAGAVNYSDTTILREIAPTWKVRAIAFLPWLVIAAVFLIILALARPQLGLKQTIIRRETVDIIMAIDISNSMLAEDYRLKGKATNRLEVVKSVARRFIDKRPDDRIGLIIFAGQSYILAPLTWDHQWCISRLQNVRLGTVVDGTAIGSAVATAVNRLKESKAKSRVIILLTDGINNSGSIMPEAAAKAAKSQGIVIYAIGAGSKGPVPFPTVDKSGHKTYEQVQMDLDERLLNQIAMTTGGQYFLATDTKSLEAIFEQINRMQKSALNMPRYGEYLELYPFLLLAVLILILIESILANTVLRRLP